MMARPISPERQAAQSLAGDLAAAGRPIESIRQTLSPLYQLSDRTLSRIMDATIDATEQFATESVTLTRTIERLKTLYLKAERDSDYRACCAIAKEIRETSKQLRQAFKDEAQGYAGAAEIY